MSIFRINFKTINPRNGRKTFLIFETHHDSVESLLAAMDRGLVLGWKLYTRSVSDRGTFEVTGRVGYSLRMSDDIEAVIVPNCRYIEYRDEAAS
jgi:hypothetical protein